jgi:hypothetical protein
VISIINNRDLFVRSHRQDSVRYRSVSVACRVSRSRSTCSHRHELMDAKTSFDVISPFAERTHTHEPDRSRRERLCVSVSRTCSTFDQLVQVYNSIGMNENKSIVSNVLTPSSLINNNVSSGVSQLSPATSFDEHHRDSSPLLNLPKSNESHATSNVTVASTMKKASQSRSRHRKATTLHAAVSIAPVSIAPNVAGRALAPAPSNLPRVVPSTKRCGTSRKRPTKSSMSNTNESVAARATTVSSSPPVDPFAESISGLMEYFDQELIASNFLSQGTMNTGHIRVNESSENKRVRTLDQIDLRQIVNTTLQQTETCPSVSTIDQFNERYEPNTTLTNGNAHEYNVDNEQITSLITDEEMRFVEMNFDENTFLRQFDLDDPGLKFIGVVEPTLFPSLLTTRQASINVCDPSHESLPAAAAAAPCSSHSTYPGSSLINSNVFTTIVPLAYQQQQQIRPLPNAAMIDHPYRSRLSPEEGVRLT